MEGYAGVGGRLEAKEEKAPDGKLGRLKVGGNGEAGKGVMAEAYGDVPARDGVGGGNAEGL